MKHLQELIEKEKKLIEEELNDKKDEKLEFYRDVFSKNDLSTISGLFHANPLDIAIAILAKNDTSENIELLKRTVYRNRIIFEFLDKEGLDSLLSILALMKEVGFYDELYNTLKNKKKYSPKGLFDPKYKSINAVLFLIKTLNFSEEDFMNFMELDRKYHEDVMAVCSLLVSIRQIKHEIDLAKIPIGQAIEQMEEALENNVNIQVGVELEHIWDVKGFIKETIAAKKYFLHKDELEKRNRNKLLNTLRIYEGLEIELKSLLETKEIVNYKSLINKISNPEIKTEVLKIIYEHNQKYNEELISTYNDLISNDIITYQMVLTKYGLQIKKSEVTQIIANNSLEDIKKMLKVITRFKIFDKKTILDILTNSNLNTIVLYEKIISKGIITPEFLINNNLLNKKSAENISFNKNIELLKEKKFSLNNFSNSTEILITNHETFRKNINIIEEYKLLGQLKAGMNYNFLSQENLSDNIDLLLEFGYETKLEEYPELLNYSENFERLKIIKELNIPLSTIEDIIKVLTTPKFFVSDEEIGNYLYNSVDYNIPNCIIEEGKEKVEITEELEQLSEYINTERTYNFDGVLISRNKVSRNLKSISKDVNQESRMLYGIIAGSTLSDDELITIKKKILQQEKSIITKQKI